MISKETLNAVNNGILTNEQLNEAIKHYILLTDVLKCHGEIYHVVWIDAYRKLLTLEEFQKTRQNKK